MSEKKRDHKGRWRRITVAFQASPEESARINSLVHISGLSKQEYIIRKLQDETVVVVGNPRVHKALKTEIGKILTELQRIQDASQLDSDLAELIHHVATVYDGLGGDCHEGHQIL